MDRAPLYSSFPMTSSPWVICNRGTLLFPFPHERASEREWLNATKPHQTAGFLEFQLSRQRTEKEERQALLMKCLEASKIMTTRFCVWHKSELKSQRQRAWLLLILLGNYLIVICGIVCHYEWVVKIMRSLNNKLRDSIIFGHFIVKKNSENPEPEAILHRGRSCVSSENASVVSRLVCVPLKIIKYTQFPI